jgi:hypothetical protein
MRLFCPFLMAACRRLLFAAVVAPPVRSFQLQAASSKRISMSAR